MSFWDILALSRLPFFLFYSKIEGFSGKGQKVVSYRFGGHVEDLFLPSPGWVMAVGLKLVILYTGPEKKEPFIKLGN
jgi:hypothetical protein